MIKERDYFHAVLPCLLRSLGVFFFPLFLSAFPVLISRIYLQSLCLMNNSTTTSGQKTVEFHSGHADFLS